MREVLTCPICQCTKFQVALTCKDFTVSGELFPIKQCRDCQLLITSPAPEPEDLPAYYQSVEYISHTSEASSLVDSIYLLVRSYTLKWKLRLITQSSESPTAPTVLDYGCGTGEFLQVCKSAGWRITGVEPSAIARNKAESNCQQYIASSLQEIQSNNIEVITLWHVLEHVQDINSLLRELKNKLHSNGRLIIAVPNPSSWESGHYKNYWAGYDVPRHLWHFTQTNIKALLHNNGFVLDRLVPMKLDAFYVSLLSEKYFARGTTTPLGILRAIFNGIRSNIKANKSGEYSSIIYIAKK